MSAGAFTPLIRSLELLGPIGIGAAFVVPLSIFAVLARLQGARLEGSSLVGALLITPIQFLTLWYLVTTIYYLPRHEAHAFRTLWPSSFAAAALASSFVLVLGITRKERPRWFDIAAFLYFTLFLGLAFQFVTYFLHPVGGWRLSWF